MTEDWDIQGAVDEINDELIDKLTVIGALVTANAQDITPTITGNLKGSINYQVNKEESSVIIGTAVEYAAYVEYGTGEFAENGDGRKGGWVYSDGKGFHFTKGSRPRRFLRDGLKNSENEIMEILAK